MFMFIWLFVMALILFNNFRTISKVRKNAREIAFPKLVWENEQAKQALANIDSATERKPSFGKPTYIYSDEQIKLIKKAVYPDTAMTLKKWIIKTITVSMIVILGVTAIFVLSLIFVAVMQTTSANM